MTFKPKLGIGTRTAIWPFFFFFVGKLKRFIAFGETDRSPTTQRGSMNSTFCTYHINIVNGYSFFFSYGLGNRSGWIHCAFKSYNLFPPGDFSFSNEWLYYSFLLTMCFKPKAVYTLCLKSTQKKYGHKGISFKMHSMIVVTTT